MKLYAVAYVLAIPQTRTRMSIGSNIVIVPADDEAHASQRVRNGIYGVMPSACVEITGVCPCDPKEGDPHSIREASPL